MIALRDVQSCVKDEEDGGKAAMREGETTDGERERLNVFTVDHVDHIVDLISIDDRLKISLF